MPSNISLFEEALEPRYCKLLLEEARSELSNGRSFCRSSFHWEEALRRASAPVLVRDFDPVQASFITGMLKQRGVIDSTDYSVMCHVWPHLSFIPWHLDGKYKNAVTIFLNEEWDRNWGGIFLYEESGSGQISGVVPRFNLGIRNSAILPHAITHVSTEAPEPRFTLQLFNPPLNKE